VRSGSNLWLIGRRGLRYGGDAIGILLLLGVIKASLEPAGLDLEGKYPSPVDLSHDLRVGGMKHRWKNRGSFFINRI
jgi:hypothetical protein